MASTALQLFSMLISSFVVVQMAMAGNPDILSDFELPPNVTNLDGSFFTFTGLRALVGNPVPSAFKASKISMAEFPALNGQSVSYAVLQFPAGTINPPHYNSRATGLLFLLQGTLQVGFIDTTNKLFTQTLQAGDMFIFPRALVHYQYNPDPQKPALAIAAFGSASAGTVTLTNNLFTSGIDDNILALSFKTDVATIKALKDGLAPKP
ncbi:germin-like protein 9-3 [Quillaja saponaria]|uniref:Germin-like protein n=1 Tax=Quillaja saponaria TaxID=32244 RepID=A0AAD7LH25_QUISA|nr:germin-like protein 9-3 [Quillaja saponaria]